MSKVKKSWITIISLFAALFLILGFAFGLPKISAYANTYAPSSVFSAGTGGTVDASDSVGEEGNEKSYVRFTFSDGGKVHFRRDLALKWFAKNEETDAVEVNYFSMQFAFGEINFEKFTIDFESAEENISKDGKATNSITFEKGEGDNLKIKINDQESAVTVDKAQDILITLDEGDGKADTAEDNCDIGEFNVRIKNVDGSAEKGKIAGKFTNIGGYFMEYRSSSSSTPNTPITFTAQFAKDTEASVKQTLLMKSLNNQPMELDSSSRVVDKAPAVLVLNEEVYAFKLGQKFSLSYEAIDVLDDNVSVSREYYMLKSETKDDTTIYYMPNEKEIKTPSDATDEQKTAYAEYEKYNYKSLTTSTYFLPSQDNNVNPADGNPTEYVSIRFKLDDDTDENDTYVYLNWYAAKNAVAEKNCTGFVEEEGEGDSKTVTEKSGKFEFIKVDRDKKGPVYQYLTADTTKKENVIADADKQAFEDAVTAYQEDLDIAADYEKSETSAGTGAYIYLPSLRGLIKSDYAGYRNLKFSIYYYKPSQSEGATASSQTSLSYNALKLEITEKGVYKFRVLAQDASGNAMQYYLDGELVNVTSSNIWDIDGIPEFTFEIDYKGPKIEDTEEQSLGYRNDTYNFSSFDIVALSGYQTNYTLYRYNSANIPADFAAEKKPSSYSDFVEKAKGYIEAFTDYDKNQKDKDKKILYEISVFDDSVSEEDEAKWNRTDNDYYWEPDSSLSFIPQEAGFYVLKLRVEDNVLPGMTAEAFQVIEVRNPIDTIPGQSQWLEENVVSVVLFAISGVLAIVVVVLFLVKPADKKVEEVDLEKLKGKKKTKTEKKK